MHNTSKRLRFMIPLSKHSLVLFFVFQRCRRVLTLSPPVPGGLCPWLLLPWQHYATYLLSEWAPFGVQRKVLCKCLSNLFQSEDMQNILNMTSFLVIGCLHVALLFVVCCCLPVVLVRGVPDRHVTGGWR